jgi:hypothetical protein
MLAGEPGMAKSCRTWVAVAVAVAAEAVEQPRGLFAVGAALPGAGLLGGAEAQPPAD